MELLERKTGRIGGLSITANYNNTPPTNGLYVEGNVGLGTAIPGFKLDVNGVINTNSYMPNAQGVYVDGGTNIGINNNAGSLAFRTNSVDNRMIIDLNGNVGIGTTNTHGYKFAVNGNIHTQKSSCRSH